MKLSIHPRSIAFRLIVAVLAVELVSSILVVVLSFGYERHIHFRSFDVMVHGHADSVLGAVQDADDSGDNVILDQADLHVPPEDIYEVWDSSGPLLGRSPNWPGTPNIQSATPSPSPHSRGGDFSQSYLNGRQYRILKMRGSRTVDPGEHGGKVRQVVILYGSPTDRVWHAIEGAVEFYAAGSVLLLLVTGPLIAWLLHRGLLPLRQLASLASHVSADSWHFAPPPSAYATPELAPLTTAIENVLHRLERSFLQQKAFVSDAAHELKTAVAVVKSSLQLIAMKPRSAEEYQAGLERCLTDCLRLEVLVADMLNLARAENVAATPEHQSEADLRAGIRQAVAQLHTIADLRDVQVFFSEAGEAAAPNSIYIPASHDECALLVSNLLLNALQHSPAESTVTVKLVRDEAHGEANAILVIQDQGSGIPPEALPHVFDRFYRGDPSRSRETGGTGLGLAISKAIVQKAGGSISITSQANHLLPFQGTAVTVRLPIADCRPAVES